MTRLGAGFWIVAALGLWWAAPLAAQAVRLPAAGPPGGTYDLRYADRCRTEFEPPQSEAFPRWFDGQPGPPDDVPPAAWRAGRSEMAGAADRSGPIELIPGWEAAEPPAEGGYPGRLLSYPDSTGELPQRPFPPTAEEAAEPAKPGLPPGARPGVFQKLALTGTWLAPGGADGFGIYELELAPVLALPFPLPGAHLVITPGFGVHYLDGPRGADLPPQLFDAYTQFRVMWPATERIGVDAAVTPGVFSDFHAGSDDSLRIAGHAAVMIQWRPTVKILVGASYPAREDASVLPIGGVIWTPNEDWKFEVVAPRPKIARRLYWGGCPSPDRQQWLYVAGEWGGGSWAFRRTGGLDDVVTLSDLRVILGWERTAVGGLYGRFEVGYVFSRSIDYKSGLPDVDPGDTILLRGGLTY